MFFCHFFRDYKPGDNFRKLLFWSKKQFEGKTVLCVIYQISFTYENFFFLKLKKSIKRILENAAHHNGHEPPRKKARRTDDKPPRKNDINANGQSKTNVKKKLIFFCLILTEAANLSKNRCLPNPNL